MTDKEMGTLLDSHLVATKDVKMVKCWEALKVYSKAAS